MPGSAVAAPAAVSAAVRTTTKARACRLPELIRGSGVLCRQAHREGPVRHKWGTLASTSDSRNRSAGGETHQTGDTGPQHKPRKTRPGVVRCRPVRWRTGTFPARLLAFLAAAGLALTAAAAGGADSAPTLRSRAAALRAQNSSLAGRSHAVLLHLYSLETRLGSARARLAVLERQATALARERRHAARDLRIAREAVAISHRRLAQRLRVLYEQGEVDPVAVVLGASSLNDAITSLDNLNRTALLDQSVLEQTLQARTHLRTLSRRLAARSAAVEDARRSAAASPTTCTPCSSSRLRRPVRKRSWSSTITTRMPAMSAPLRISGISLTWRCTLAAAALLGSAAAGGNLNGA